MKKQSIGFILSVITVVAALVGLVGYLINCSTNYFANLGVDAAVVGCAVAAIVAVIVYVVVNMKGVQTWADILPVVAAALLMAATLLLVNTRVNAIAAVMTFENNAKNMADLVSCIVGIAGCLVATIVAVISSFFDIVKE